MCSQREGKPKKGDALSAGHKSEQLFREEGTFLSVRRRAGRCLCRSPPPFEAFIH